MSGLRDRMLTVSCVMSMCYYATHTSTPHEQVHPSLIAYFARLFTHRPAPFTHTHTLTCAHCPSSHSTADVSQSRDYSSDSLPTSMIRLTLPYCTHPLVLFRYSTVHHHTVMYFYSTIQYYLFLVLIFELRSVPFRAFFYSVILPLFS